jgi:hypothetical protein
MRFDGVLTITWRRIKIDPFPLSIFFPSQVSWPYILGVGPNCSYLRHHRALGSYVSLYRPYLSRLDYPFKSGEYSCTLLPTFPVTKRWWGSWAFFWFITCGVSTVSSACGTRASSVHHLGLTPSIRWNQGSQGAFKRVMTVRRVSTTSIPFRLTSFRSTRTCSACR